MSATSWYVFKLNSRARPKLRGFPGLFMRYYRFLISAVITAVGLTTCSMEKSNAQSSATPKKLAPGVLKVIQPWVDPRDTHTLPMSTPGINATPFEPKQSPVSTTLAEQSRRIVMFRDAWQYEFAFLGLRQIELDVAASDGSTVKRNFWYMVYRIRNTGEVLVNDEIRHPRFGTLEYEKLANFENMSPERREQAIAKLENETLFGRFIGNFRLEGWVENISNGEYTKVSYRPVIDRSIAAAIQQEEDPATELLTSIDLMKKSFPIVPERSEFGGLWGVAIWENVDPRIDYVSVFVNGLTNAYRLAKTPDGEWKTVRKTLQLNFWRPGDAIEQAKDPVGYGIPLVDDFRRQIEICRRFNLPGPVIQGFEFDQVTTRRRQIIEVDSEFSLRKMESELANQLDGGTIPQSVLNAFQDAGMPLPDNVQPQTTIKGKQWTFGAIIDGENKSILIELIPQFWEPAIEEGIRFTKTLDHLWIYQ